MHLTAGVHEVVSHEDNSSAAANAATANGTSSNGHEGNASAIAVGFAKRDHEAIGSSESSSSSSISDDDHDVMGGTFENDVCNHNGNHTEANLWYSAALYQLMYRACFSASGSSAVIFMLWKHRH